MKRTDRTRIFLNWSDVSPKQVEMFYIDKPLYSWIIKNKGQYSCTGFIMVILHKGLKLRGNVVRSKLKQKIESLLAKEIRDWELIKEKRLVIKGEEYSELWKKKIKYRKIKRIAKPTRQDVFNQLLYVGVENGKF